MVISARSLSLMVLLALFSLVSCSSREKDLKNRKANIHFGAGTQSLMAGNYTEALTNLKKADELDPQNPDIMVNLGMAYYFKDERDIAVKYLQKSLEIKPKENSDARINLASIYYREGNYTEAEKLYKQVLKDLTYDKQARTYYNLGMLEFEQKKNTVAAESYFKKSIKEDDNYCPSYFQLGILNYKRRQFKTSLKNFKEASMGMCNESPAAHFYQGLVLIELRRFTDARMKFDEVETRFKKSIYSAKARTKITEINALEMKTSEDTQVSKRLIDVSEF
jgi:type IV pilus assembly protein PilF